MKKIITLFLFTTCLASLLFAQPTAPSYWQQQAHYNIEVTLHDTTHTLDGEVKIQYFNRSPDTLRFLWIHLWPNAYKNDRTAFANQLLLERNTDFYFSRQEEKGYINRINFTANNQPAVLEDHPVYIDVARLILPAPLLPGDSLLLHTPFHVQLPHFFSRSGHMNQFYAAAQWFPKIAMYDAAGWHPMPYLSAGEFYSNFGDYKVRITLPENYVVAATGVLINPEEKEWMRTRTAAPMVLKPPVKKQVLQKKTAEPFPVPPSSGKTKTLHYEAHNVVDFTWAADKRFLVKFDTCIIEDKPIEVWNFLLPWDEKNWNGSMRFSKRAIRFYSKALGPYPYPQLSVVASPGSEADGMEYPMLTLLNEKSGDSTTLDIIIAHEIGHNWLQAVLATNERETGWMDEGMNTYLEQKYTAQYHGEQVTKPKAKLPYDVSQVLLDLLIERKLDVPMQVAADTAFPTAMYLSIYQKAAQWMQLLEQKIGPTAMEQLMKQYYRQWQFKHPKPKDFFELAAQQSPTSLDDHFELVQKTGPLQQAKTKKTTLTSFFNLTHTENKKYIGIAPAIGFNQYDKLQLGLLIHNYNIPASKLQFVATPMLATGTKQPVGYARVGYHWYPSGKWYKATLYSSFARFHFDEGRNAEGSPLPIAFTKAAPGLLLEWKKKYPLSTIKRTVDFRTFIINEQQLANTSPPPPGDTVFFAVRNGSSTTIIPQVKVRWQDTRVLYPWSIEATVQQVKQIVRLSAEAHYFLNYGKSGKGISARLFAGKIFYTVEKTLATRSNNSRYHFTMQGPNGQQDYTYSNPFAERNQSAQLGGRQIMMRDGGFKYRSDFSSVVPGLKTTAADFFDNWMVTLNTNFDVPDAIYPLAWLPFKNRLQLFADLGTSASPWQAGSTHPKFLYSIGIHLPLLKVVHLYYPLIQSKAFKEPNSVNDPFRPGGPRWWQQRLTFSIQIEDLIPKIEGIRLL